MINYTERLSTLMHDVVARVSALSFINVDDVLVFARFGRADAEGPFATCHCLNLPESEPGYYFWRDRETGRITRRSEWFVTKSPRVELESRHIDYMVSFALPRFCDQTLTRSRKESLYPGGEPWIAKLDTVVHELYHIDPDQPGIRRVERADGTYSRNSHSPEFFEDVTRMVRQYLATNPDAAIYEFLKYDLQGLMARYGGVVATTFRTFPSYPQRYIEALARQPKAPKGAELVNVPVEPIRVPQLPTAYSHEDLDVREFRAHASRRLERRCIPRAA